MMLTLLVWLVALGATPFAVRFAAVRAAAQPFPIDVDAERLVVAGAEAGWRDDAEPLTPEMFTDEELAGQWSAYLDGGDGGGVPVERQLWLAAGSRVITAAADRDLMSGRGQVGVDGEGAPVRLPSRVGAGRVVAALAPVAAAGAACLLFGFAPLVSAALAVLTLAAVVIALVDWDTLYVDLPATALATVAAGAALALSWGPGSAAGLVGGAATVGVLLAVLGAYRVLRGFWGMAFGDVMLMVPFLVLPAGVLGSPAAGLWAFMAALVGSLVGYAATHRAGKSVPFAFGPYVVFGWVAPVAAAGLAAAGVHLGM